MELIKNMASVKVSFVWWWAVNAKEIVSLIVNGENELCNFKVGVVKGK